jgi:Fe2+ or Zn2+ uptake regulation protein
MLVGMTKSDDAAFSALCRERGWKRTAQRRAVFTYLCGNREHPTVETVWRGVRALLPDVSLDSVYRILDDFSTGGLVKKLEGAKVIRYDADTSAHEHFICCECGRMFDFACLDAELVAGMCAGFGRVDSVELSVHGMCDKCLNVKNHV